MKAAGKLLDELVQANLVTEQVSGRFALHDLMREYAVELVSADETEADRDRAVRRLLDHYLHNGYAAVTVVDPILTEEAGSALPEVLLEEMADYSAAMTGSRPSRKCCCPYWTGRRMPGSTGRYGSWCGCSYVLRPSGQLGQLVSCMETALKAGERLGEPLLQARAHRGLGNIHFRAARNEDADRHFEAALALCRGEGDLVGEAHIELGLAAFREQQGRHPEALEHALRALELHERLGDSGSHANALNSVACCYTQVGQHELALDHGRRALAAFRELKAPNAECSALDTIGEAYQKSGRLTEAIDTFQEAIGLARQVGNRFYTARSLDNLGDTYLAMGDQTAAHDAWHEAEAILDELQHPAVQQVRDKLAAVAG